MQKSKVKTGFEFIDEIFEYLNFSYSLTYKDKIKIPAVGKLIIVSNHPLGGLDGLAIIKAISEVRSDVRIVANELLMNINNLSELFLPYDVFSSKPQITNIKKIEKSIQNDEAIVIFPAGEVSRLTLNGIKDGKWQKGVIKLAEKFNIPILPIYVKGLNKMPFYIASLINKEFSTYMLPNQLFAKRNEIITLKIGDPIPAEVFSSKLISSKEQIKLLKRHVYKIGKSKSGKNKINIFKTEMTIVHPIDAKILKKELYNSKLLGLTNDGKSIFLCEHDSAPNVMKEIGRLREITFRKVGEGTGEKCDLDRFDRIYKQLVLWDSDELEIVGAYRLGLTGEILKSHGKDGIYNSEQFIFDSDFTCYLEKGIELGRSFIQEKYWRSAALDYLWQGIGAFLLEYRDVRYLFGSVSISNSYSETAKALIVAYYKKWYSANSQLARAKNRLLLSKNIEREANDILSGKNYDEDFTILRTTLKNYGYTVPVLIRRYVDLCEYGGVQFIDFGVDQSFANSIDCFILVDLETVRIEKKERYYKKRQYKERVITEISYLTENQVN